jgi:hypothetical protein
MIVLVLMAVVGLGAVAVLVYRIPLMHLHYAILV